MRLINATSRAMGLGLAIVCVALLAGCGGGGNLATGAQYQAEGKYRAAYIEAKKVLQHDEMNGAAWLLLGRASLWLGNPKEALSDLEKAKAHAAPAEQWSIAMGHALLVSQAYAKVLDTLPAKPAFDAASNAQIFTLRGDAYRGLKQFGLARSAYNDALTIVPNDAPALVGLARLAAVTHDTTAAEKYVQQALAAAPDNPQAWVTQGDLALVRGDFTAAETAFQKVLGFKHAHWLPQERFYALGQLASVQLQLNQPKQALETIQSLEKMAPQQPQPHYLHALAAYKQGQLDEAVTQLQQVLQMAPGDTRAQTLLAGVNYAQGHYAQAEMHLSNVLGADSGNQSARKLLALAQYRDGRSQQAVATLRPTVPGHPSDADLLAQLQQAVASGAGLPSAATSAAPVASTPQPSTELADANRALVSGNESEAIRLLTQMPAGDASLEAQRNIMLALSYVREKHPDEAVKVAAAYAAKHPQDSGAHLLYGTTLVTAGKHDAARAQYNEALKLNPKNVAAELSLGSLDALAGHDADAAGHYQAVLKRDPHNAAAMIELGRLTLRQGDKPRATKWFEQAIAAAPNNANAYVALITLQTRAGQFDDALTTAQRLSSAAPGNPVALNALGAAQFNAGHHDDALQPLQQAVALAPQVGAYRLNLARAQRVAGHAADATRNLEELLKSDPGDVAAAALLAQMKAQDHDLPGALALARSLQQQPAASSKVAGFALEGDLYMADKQFGKADDAYQSGLKIQPVRALVIKHFQALAASGAKSPEGVLSDWLGQHPNDHATRLLLGQYYLGQSQLPQAAAQYERVLKAHSDDAGALNNLAWIYTQQHNPKALALAERAHTLAPHSPGVADTYGWALLSANRAKDALPILLKAAKAAPKAAEIQYHLAVAQSRTGDEAAARATLEAMRKTGGDFPEKKAVDALYQKLGGH